MFPSWENAFGRLLADQLPSALRLVWWLCRWRCKYTGSCPLVGAVVSALGGVDLERRLVSCIVTYCSHPAAYQGCWWRHRMFPEEHESKNSPNITMLLAFLVITSASWIRVWGWSLHLKCSSVSINFAEPENLLMTDSCLWPLARLCCVSLRINRKTLTPGTWYPLCLWIFSYLLVLILFPCELIFHFIF